MNGRRHWTDFTEAQLAQMRRPIRASRPARGPQQGIPSPGTESPSQTAATEPAYPPDWLPEVQARSAVRAQTPAEWMEDNAPDPAEHRNGTAPAGSPSADAYPREWLSDIDRTGLGEGWINRRAA